MTQEEFDRQYLTEFNEQQLQAVHAVDGPILLLAVPGSGKTTVLVHRLGYMVHCLGIDPSRILTITFTVAATKEMRERYGKVFGQEYSAGLEFRTINGLSQRIIDHYVKNYGNSSLTLVEDPEKNHILRDLYQRICNEYPTETTLRDVSTMITNVKNGMLSKEEIGQLNSGIAKFPQLYQAYRNCLRQGRRMDYDDQMVYALQILQEWPQVLEYFQAKYLYLCVDEAQDTSKIQHEIIAKLAWKNQNIFMVGDEDQSIYGFRAAYPQALTQFSQTYPDAKILLMETNYRSTPEILSAANAFVARNKERYKKSSKAVRDSGIQVQLIRTLDRSTQYQYLYQMAQSCSTETAVLYRNNDNPLPLIDLLERGQVPYRCRSLDSTYFSNQVFADFENIIRFAQNPKDTDRFLKFYYKVGLYLTREEATAACENSQKRNTTILEELPHVPNLSSGKREAVGEFCQFVPKILTDNGEQAVKRIWNDLQYSSYAAKQGLDAGKFELLCLLGQQVSGALELLSRLAELRVLISEHHNPSPSSCKFILSTIHSSKGLEYERVYLLDTLNGILPSKPENALRDEDDQAANEEDRRLFYVAMTRAKDELYLFDCSDRDASFIDELKASLSEPVIDADDLFAPLLGDLVGKTYSDTAGNQGSLVAQNENQFLVRYLDNHYEFATLDELFHRRNRTIRYAPHIDKPAHPQALSAAWQTAVSNAEKSSREQFQAGSRVQHKIFGIGTVQKVELDTITICFDRIGLGTKDLKLSTCMEHGYLIKA